MLSKEELQKISAEWDIDSANSIEQIISAATVQSLLAHIRELEEENARLRTSGAHNSVKLNEVLYAVLHGSDNTVCPPHDYQKECIETGDCASCWEKHLSALNVTKESTND